jgi:hypothetical protein
MAQRYDVNSYRLLPLVAEMGEIMRFSEKAAHEKKTSAETPIPH